ncbi:hypothetical protein BDK51DRAFT_49997 [Blyttiomyces helicus]|uniref:Uncharacterized protein n=1 Tax=Blyttiomyces helicus TaxID=388810 RepID=A0A4P9VW89_9FUNG|nr:hypothetical protein BDK51DRAFT_49997 [Blyttiomyces helicus]|eukprot:RKO83412.1 hypothetical protein BDK51DRAFT_49997 [Blyttiomyces helicus]
MRSALESTNGNGKEEEEDEAAPGAEEISTDPLLVSYLMVVLAGEGVAATSLFRLLQSGPAGKRRAGIANVIQNPKSPARPQPAPLIANREDDSSVSIGELAPTETTRPPPPHLSPCAQHSTPLLAITPSHPLPPAVPPKPRPSAMPQDLTSPPPAQPTPPQPQVPTPPPVRLPFDLECMHKERLLKDEAEQNEQMRKDEADRREPVQKEAAERKERMHKDAVERNDWLLKDLLGLAQDPDERGPILKAALECTKSASENVLEEEDDEPAMGELPPDRGHATRSSPHG